MSELDRLIEAVEAGDDDVNWFPISGHSAAKWGYCQRAYEGSIDAALAMHEALLPGCGWKTQKLLCNDYYTADVWGEYAYSESTGTALNPARAWLIAVLKAYREITH